MTYAGTQRGTIHAADGTDWGWEITPMSDARLMFVIRAPDKTWRSGVAPEQIGLVDLRRLIERLIASKTVN